MNDYNFYLAYLRSEEYPFTYIFAKTEEEAKVKALEIAKEDWTLNKEKYNSFWACTGSKFEDLYGKLPTEKDINIWKEKIHIVDSGK